MVQNVRGEGEGKSLANPKRDIWGGGVQRTSILMLHNIWMMPY